MPMNAVMNKLLDEIEGEEDCTTIVRKTALILRAMDAARDNAKKEQKEADDEMKKDIKEISKIVIGNGEPEKSLVVMVKTLKQDFEKRMKKSDRLSWLILATVLGYVMSQLLGLI